MKAIIQREKIRHNDLMAELKEAREALPPGVLEGDLTREALQQATLKQQEVLASLERVRVLSHLAHNQDQIIKSLEIQKD